MKSSKYRRGLPYLKSIRKGTESTGTPHCRTLFSGMPKSSRLRNPPKSVHRAMTPSSAHQSSGSIPNQVTRCARLRFTWVTFRDTISPPSKAGRVGHKELGQPQDTGGHQAQACRRQMPQPGAAGHEVTDVDVRG